METPWAHTDLPDAGPDEPRYITWEDECSPTWWSMTYAQALQFGVRELKVYPAELTDKDAPLGSVFIRIDIEGQPPGEYVLFTQYHLTKWGPPKFITERPQLLPKEAVSVLGARGRTGLRPLY